MKVLWFSLTPCNGVGYIGNKGVFAGWLQSLEAELKGVKDIDLSVCFVHSNPIKPFKYENVSYYPVSRKWDGNILKKWLKMFYWGTPLVDASLISDFLDIVNKVQPDLIHIHGTEECFGLIQEKLEIPVVISIQGILAPYREKLFSGLTYSSIKKYQSFLTCLKLSNIEHTKRIFDRTAKRERVILKNAKYVIGRTEWDKRVMSVLAPEAKYFVGNELMRADFYKKKWNKTKFNKKFTIISTVSGGYYKGLELIYKTAKLLRHNNFEFEWKVVGLDKDHRFVNLVEKIENLRAKDLKIIFEGRKNELALSELLVSADCYCQVSHIENSPNSLCEAMLVGMPIVASFVGGTDSLITNKESGVLVQDGDPYSYAGALLQLSNDENKASVLAEEARKIALIRHDKNKVVKEYLAIYNYILCN